ncbi:hypothetical protein UA08_03024 [Talaromyces atroroseus]|uniref:Aldehyde dehydrogenase domain-containing protein n=1 Tax=Talaromyces atroroseus TaxID=1441469 RepID=A0A225ALN6_TALAT|nr:hypothetical protein UA08_03024 [Talaromyces atroroseus]OKL61820.1 hypothetical protein UA08_03024 [Talaromyces atroroseus]
MWFLKRFTDMSSQSSSIKYQSLTGSQSDEAEIKPLFLARSWVNWAAFPLLAIVALVMIFLAGRQSALKSYLNESHGLLVPPGTVHQVWEHNLTFSQRPTPESEAAWDSLIPVGRGFVHHPQLAPFVANIAVFHQLHCLHAIRVAYYTIHNDTSIDDGHLRHCFDYLRQALMCAADTNLEHVNRETRITTGWGSDKLCRDYGQVVDWAVQWANSSDTGIMNLLEMSSAHRVPLIIHGEEEAGESAFDVISPYTNKTCWTAASATPTDAIRAIESSERAFPAWSSTKPTVRRDILLKAADILESRLEQNAEFMRVEMGADVASSTGFVAPLGIKMLRDIACRITSVCGHVPVVEAEGQSAIVYREPMGVILGIVPWNAPYVFAIRAAACALAGGNTTVIKSSEQTPRCYYAVARAFLDAGLPAGCFNLVSTRPQDALVVVNTMIEHPAIRKVNFTGSTAVGRKVAALCGQNLKPCLMELGGKNNAIVCEDANLETAALAVLMGAFINSGQICMSTDRIILNSAIAQDFNIIFKKMFDGFFSELAPTIVSMAAKKRVSALICDALSAGAEVAHGVFNGDIESDPASVRMPPVVLGNVNESMRAWQEESFASFAAYMVVDSDDEAIRLANAGGYGLSAAVFTEDLRKGLAMAKKIQSGAVHINSMTVHDEPALPHGGVKNSGWGRFNTEEGVKEFLATKSVTWMD